MNVQGLRVAENQESHPALPQGKEIKFLPVVCANPGSAE